MLSLHQGFVPVVLFPISLYRLYQTDHYISIPNSYSKVANKTWAAMKLDFTYLTNKAHTTDFNNNN